ncbi:hypothetical protein [Tropicimonas sediminicola]|uniref:hypothetical protein n=1 Tax=Tropicimonas sediminicola TaxID=1031541 RepID=UPI00113222FF|nr:hypothetical protein [Tropicimonas sediminicola]
MRFLHEGSVVPVPGKKKAATPGRRKVSPPKYRQPREEDGFSDLMSAGLGRRCRGGDDTREEGGVAAEIQTTQGGGRVL